MRGGRSAIAVVAVVLFGLVDVGSALGCSCAPSTPAESLAASDAAIAARLISVHPEGLVRAVYRYEVLHVYRGRRKVAPGSTLRVTSPRGAAACALPDGICQRYGLFLLGEGRRWIGGLCGVLSPRRLWIAARGPGADRPSAAPSNCAG